MEAQAIRTLQKKRTSNFREDETKLLIQLWGSPYIQNKLYLTHRKAPVMRILAANMQQRGFYRTPDEIKTRIRNLKCLYHRIKRSTSNGTGVGTVDPDWPHYKAMDAILNKESQKKIERLPEGVLEGPRCEDIKQEVDIDINDDMESWATNDSIGSETSEEPPPLPALKPAPQLKKLGEKEIQQSKPVPILPSFTIPTQNGVQNTNQVKPGSVPSYPLPLLILNGLQPQQAHGLDKNKTNTATNSNNGIFNGIIPNDIHNLLKQLLEVQKENLDLEKQRLELEKQRMEFNRVVGSQLLTLVPMIGGILQRVALGTQDSNTNAVETMKGRKRQNSDELDILKDSKILRSVLEQGIRKYMLGEENDLDNDKDDDEDEKDSDPEDSGVQIEENSN